MSDKILKKKKKFSSQYFKKLKLNLQPGVATRGSRAQVFLYFRMFKFQFNTFYQKIKIIFLKKILNLVNQYRIKNNS